MDKNNPEKGVSRSTVTPIKIDSIYIDFRCYTKQQDGGNSQNHSPNRNTSVELSKSANDSSNKKENSKTNQGDFNMRKYVAQKNREQYADRGELLAIEPNSNDAPVNMDESTNLNEARANINESPNSNEAPSSMDKSLTCANRLGTANPSSIHNITVTTGLDDEYQKLEKKTLEDPKGVLSLSEGLDVHIREENPVVTEVGNAYPAFTANWAVGKNRRSRRKSRKLRLVSDIHQKTKPIAQRSITTFQVVNVIEDFKLEEDEEECSNIRIRRRKHAKPININEGVGGKK